MEYPKTEKEIEIYYQLQKLMFRRKCLEEATNGLYKAEIIQAQRSYEEQLKKYKDLINT